MYNICRPIILHNDFLPPVREEHKDWGYLSFGYNDGVSIGENLFENGKCDFSALWKYYVGHGQSLDGSCSSQILWGLRCETEEGEEIKDCDFWKTWDKSEKYPFLFITLLQVSKSMKDMNLEWENRKRLEIQLTVPSVRKAITYLTFDNSDLILILQCRNYEDGAKIINQFHYDSSNMELIEKDGNLSYSFTVASINKHFLMDTPAIERMTEIMHRAYIYVIEGKPGCIGDVYEEIEDVLKVSGFGKIEQKETILGCNDEVIVISEVPWKVFLKFFQDKTGILNHSYPKYKDRLIGVTTILGQSLTEEHDVSGNTKDRGMDDETTIDILLSTSMREKCNSMTARSENDKARMDAVRRNIFQVINSLHKFEVTPFRDYLFQTIFLPLNMVIDMAGESVAKRNELYLREDFFSSFYEFMKALNLYAQNSWHSDRQFTQTPNLNVRIYDTPVKLNAFYNAFIYYLKQYLNNLDDRENDKQDGSGVHEYEFLACPGVANNMRVQELFKRISTTKRLFLVEIPENQVYNPRTMLVMLAHEVGHFVGMNVRNREGRFEFAIIMAGKAVVRYMKISLEEYLGKKSDEFSAINNEEYWGRTETLLINKLRNFCNSYEKYLENEKFIKGSGDSLGYLKVVLSVRKYHSEMLRMILTDGLSYVLMHEVDVLWEYLWEKDFLYWLEKNPEQAEKRRYELQRLVQERIQRFLSYDKWNRNTLSVSSIVNLIVDISKECIADLVAILTLELSLKDYLETILQSARDQGFGSKFGGKNLIVRSSLVTFCMLPGKKKTGYLWGVNEPEEILQGNNKNMKELWVGIRNFISDYLGRTECKMENPEINNALDLLSDTEIFIVMLQYLLKSKDIFSRYNKGQVVVQQKKLVEIYRMLEKNNIDNLVLEMQRYVGQYLNEIKTRNKIYAEGKD